MTKLAYITPTEAATYYNLHLIIIGGIGGIILTELIKNKKSTPVSSLSAWAAIFGIITAMSVFDLTRRTIT